MVPKVSNLLQPELYSSCSVAPYPHMRGGKGNDKIIWLERHRWFSCFMLDNNGRPYPGGADGVRGCRSTPPLRWSREVWNLFSLLLRRNTLLKVFKHELPAAVEPAADHADWGADPLTLPRGCCSHSGFALLSTAFTRIVSGTSLC
jgi:hypothetical protein